MTFSVAEYEKRKEEEEKRLQEQWAAEEEREERAAKLANIQEHLRRQHNAIRAEMAGPLFPIDKAKAFLREMLPEAGADEYATLVEIRRKEEGIALRTLERAKKKLGIQSVKREESWFWVRK